MQRLFSILALNIFFQYYYNMKQFSPHVSVIIPVYNRPVKVARAIYSVLNQEILPQEIIVVNDGSDDETSSVLDTFSADIRVLYQDNKGVSAARNLGILAAEGNWIAFLDSDDEWKPDKLKKQLRYLREHPDICILQTDEIWIRKGKRVNPGKKYTKKGGDIFEECLPYCIVSPSTILCKKSLFDTIGGFDESLPVCEDYDLWLRIAAKYPIPLLPDATIFKHGGHTNQLSLTIPAMDRYRVRSLEKILKTEPLTETQRNALLHVLIQKLTYLRDGALRQGMDVSGYAEKINIYQKY